MKAFSMARKHLTLLPLLTAAFGIVALFTGCKGRTAENMVPTGDTVEVEISKPSPENDSISNSTITDTLK